ncbi:PDF receptor [Eurytemora carolleeae]|uniref:PDF receptor n=1 Tax=Eurytemora carolleeae TaxID=1294199 RepID=UPI000C75A51E|nr:PDF receptor [Eurytemora carolleeae]|eukprot:XP_023323889.1 PDF receptor-like [Eurytemora affinis]
MKVYSRSLRTQEKRIHFHLYLGMFLQVSIRLILYLEQRSNMNSTLQDRIHGALSGWRGFSETEVLCELMIILLEYAKTVMFHWMFIEGIHLHNILVVNVFLTNSDRNQTIYLLVGWLLPILSTGIWAFVSTQTIHSQCWYGYNHEIYYWISEGPRLCVIAINFLFLINILRLLYSKFGSTSQDQSSLRIEGESAQTVNGSISGIRGGNDSISLEGLRSSLKAAIVLQPLLGISNFLQIVDSPYDAGIIYFTFWSFSTSLLASLQGFFAATFYCFFNKDVHKVIRHLVSVETTRRRNLSGLPRTDSSRTRASFNTRSSRIERPQWCEEERAGGRLGVWSPRGRSEEERAGSRLGVWSPRGRSVSTRGWNRTDGKENLAKNIIMEIETEI